MAILFRKVNKIVQNKVTQILSKQVEIEIFESLPRIMKCCLKNTRLQDTLSVLIKNEFCWCFWNVIYKIGLNLVKINSFVQHDVVGKVNFCNKIRKWSEYLENLVMGRDLRMSPSWKPNPQGEQLEMEMIELETEQQLHQFEKKESWWEILNKQIFGDEDLSEASIQETVEEDEVEISEEEDVIWL